MLLFTIFFLVGLLIGGISLRLLQLWEPRNGRRSHNPFTRHHS